MSELVADADLQALPLASLAEALASTAPTPGGSCAAALPAVLGAGLVAMVARLTAESDPFGDLSYDMEEVASEADELRAELLRLVAAEADAFHRVVAALRLPRETPEQRARRSLEVADAYEGAVEPPLRVCARSLRVLELAVHVAERGNPHTASDAGVAALLAAASVESSALNARFDLGPVGDDAFRAAQADGLRTIQADGESLRASAMAAVLRNVR
jgi:formiminotetrahydrofolate cyclodeaminase